MPKAQPPQPAREALLRLMKVRPRSAAEVRRKLEKTFDAQAIEDVIAWAFSCDLLDDARFARLWVEDRLARRPSGRQNLRRELRAKGVDEPLIDAALATLDSNERDLVRTLAEARLPRYGGLPPEVCQRRLVNFLVGRGFAFDDIYAVMRELGVTPGSKS